MISLALPSQTLSIAPKSASDLARRPMHIHRGPVIMAARR